jgi:hypothetical protein
MFHPACQTEALGEGISTPPADAEGTNSFPPLTEIFQGRSFEITFERDVFFLRAVQGRYPAYWSGLLEANITLNDYLSAPSKILRFVEELGAAMRGKDDATAITNLALLTSNEDYYANTNAYHPEISRAAAQALIGVGPTGQKALAGSFTERHYCIDPGGLEDLAAVMGETRQPAPDLLKALTATAFDLSTTNGAIYPNCTKAAVRNLLDLSGGLAAVRLRLTAEGALDNPGRYQAILEGIAASHNVELATNLELIARGCKARLDDLTNSPSAYRDDLQELSKRLHEATPH